MFSKGSSLVSTGFRASLVAYLAIFAFSCTIEEGSFGRIQNTETYQIGIQTQSDIVFRLDTSFSAGGVVLELRNKFPAFAAANFDENSPSTLINACLGVARGDAYLDNEKVYGPDAKKGAANIPQTCTLNPDGTRKPLAQIVAEFTAILDKVANTFAGSSITRMQQSLAQNLISNRLAVEKPSADTIPRKGDDSFYFEVAISDTDDEHSAKFTDNTGNPAEDGRPIDASPILQLHSILCTRSVTGDILSIPTTYSYLMPLCAQPQPAPNGIYQDMTSQEAATYIQSLFSRLRDTKESDPNFAMVFVGAQEAETVARLRKMTMSPNPCTANLNMSLPDANLFASHGKRMGQFVQALQDSGGFATNSKALDFCTSFDLQSVLDDVSATLNEVSRMVVLNEAPDLTQPLEMKFLKPDNTVVGTVSYQTEPNAFTFGKEKNKIVIDPIHLINGARSVQVTYTGLPGGGSE